MIAAAIALSFLASATCTQTDPRDELLSLHETTRQAHLRGDATMIAPTIADQLLFAENGGVRVQSKAEVVQFFASYFSLVRYSEWRDAIPPSISISPDGKMAWMAVGVEARYTRADKPADGEKSFKSSWIATFERANCAWRMTGIASNIVN
jgi:hypothetical protein